MNCQTISSDDLVELFGYANKASLYSAISRGTFPIPTYKIGKRRVADRELVDGFFARHREQGQAALDAAKTRSFAAAMRLSKSRCSRADKSATKLRESRAPPSTTNGGLIRCSSRLDRI